MPQGKPNRNETVFPNYKTKINQSNKMEADVLSKTQIITNVPKKTLSKVSNLFTGK